MAVDAMTPDPDLKNMLRQWADLPDLPDDIYENYDERITPQTAAVPMTQLGPGQNPQPPAPGTVTPTIDAKTGLPIVQTREQIMNNKPGAKLKRDQTNVVTTTNQKKDAANKPTPVPNSYPRTKAAIEKANKARQATAIAKKKLTMNPLPAFERITAAILAAEDWAPTYADAPKQHAQLIKNTAKLNREVMVYLRDLAKVAPSFIDWFGYSRAVIEQKRSLQAGARIEAYDVQVIVNQDAVDQQDQDFIKLTFDTMVATTELGVQSMTAKPACL